MAQSIEQLSFEMTAGALAEQERALSALRARAGTVLAAASIASSFYGAKASHGSVGTLGVLAMLFFVLCVASAIWILLPHAFVFAFRGEQLLAAGDRPDVTATYRAAGVWIEPHLEANLSKIASLSDCLAASCVLLVAEIALWTLSLIG